MSNEPLVSVVIPCYNAGKTIADTVDSVMCQTLQDFEIILIDDGSTDDTKEVIAPFLKDKRIYYINQQNGGVANARNHGIRQAKGDFIFILDADDSIPSESLEWHIKLMRTENTRWVFCDLIRQEGEHRQIISSFMPKENPLEYALVHRFPSRSTCYHRQTLIDVVGGYNESLQVCEDWDLYAQLLKASIPFSYLDEPAYVYQIQPVSLTKGTSFVKNLDAMYVIYLVHYRPLIKSNPAIRQAYSQYMWQLASAYFVRRTRYDRVLICMLRSTAAQPDRLWSFFLRKLGLSKAKLERHA